MKKITKKRIVFVFLLCFLTIVCVFAKYTSLFDKTITLNVTKPVYTVTFHSNDGNNTTVTQNFVYGTSQALTTNSFTRQDYDFIEWNTASDGTGSTYSDEQVVNKLVSTNNGNFDLYAQWRRVLTFTVTGNPSNWTNQDVTLTIVPSISGTYQYSFDGGTTWQNSASHTFSSNQPVIMKIKAQDGYESNTKTEIITKIDKIPPTLTPANRTIVTLDESNPISEIATNMATYSDSESGIDANGLQVYRYVVATSTKTDPITNTTYFDYPGLYAVTLEVSDVAGNTTTDNSEILVRWPTGGKYVVKKTTLDGSGIKGTGKAINGTASGLYRDDANTGYQSSRAFGPKYYYSGPGVDNNTLALGSYTYNILNVATNDDIKLIAPESSRNMRWSSRRIFSTTQFGDWSTWWTNKELYYSNDSQYRTFTNEEANHIDEAEFYAGRFTKDETPSLLDTIESERICGRYVLDGEDLSPAYFSGHFAFPNVSDYIKACNRQDIIFNIQTTQDNSSVFKTCSWLQTRNEQWTMNSKNDTTTDNDFWALDPTVLNNNRVVSRTYYYYENYRPVFYLKANTILSGLGTTGDPYTVQENWSWFDNAQVLE